jgi:hypothetical protein
MWWVNKTDVAWTKDGSRPISYGLKGSSDILGCVDGRMVCVEVKTATGRQRKEQVIFQAAIERAGGIYIIARSPEEAIAGLGRAALLADANRPQGNASGTTARKTSKKRTVGHSSRAPGFRVDNEE